MQKNKYFIADVYDWKHESIYKKLDVTNDTPLANRSH